VRVASLEHLLVLKVDAYGDRKGSAKGRKDERDIIRIVYLLNSRPSKTRLGPYLDSKFFGRLTEVARSGEFVVLCKGNVHQASKLKIAYTKTLRIIEKM
jgi:hypothetical protein